MKEHGVIRRRLSGKEADPYLGLGRKILGEMKNIMRLGGIQQLSWTKDLQNGVRVVVSSIFGQDEVRILVPVQKVAIADPEKRSIQFNSEVEYISGILHNGSAGLSYKGQACIWTKGNLTELGWLLDGEVSQANDVSETGVVVGYSKIYKNTVSGDYRAFRWTRKDGMQNLGVLGGTRWSEALAISADGSTIVGYSTLDDATADYPFKWTQAEGMRQLGTAKGVATAVSADGSVIVGHYYDSPLVGFKWTKKTGMQPITISGYSFVYPESVSDDGGVITGYAQDDDGNYKLFRHTAEGTTIIGGGYSAAGISDNGNIVAGTDENYHPVIWNSKEGIITFSEENSGFLDISYDGSVGACYVGDYPARWDSKNGFVQLPTSETYTKGWASGIAIERKTKTIDNL